jgi:hypothetical protein
MSHILTLHGDGYLSRPAVMYFFYCSYQITGVDYSDCETAKQHWLENKEATVTQVQSQ